MGMARKPVTLTVGPRADGRNSSEAVVVPLGNEGVLRYADWVESNRRLVDKISGGSIGYMHFPDTYLGTAREFPKQFLGQTRKQGLVVDGRCNNGGLDPDYRIYSPQGEWIIEGHGVEPDITVELDNRKAFDGEDAQLLQAIRYLQTNIERDPPRWPERPAFPRDR